MPSRRPAHWSAELRILSFPSYGLGFLVADRTAGSYSPHRNETDLSMAGRCAK